MNAIAQDWFEIGDLSDIPLRGARRVQAGGIRIAVFRTHDNQVYALEDSCPHKQGPLSQGIIHDGCVTCPLHNWVISLESGKACGADEGQVRTFRVKLEGQRISIALSGAAALAS